jgi:A/G-specific adenine glycosylase
MSQPATFWPLIARWFEREKRDLPWRRVNPRGQRDPFAALVSEFMLQQTQVSRVLEKFGPFMARFPTAASLAAADEGEVLALWSGLGYYRRARLLHAAAKAIVDRHGGIVPTDPQALRDLPGIGRYTAGAIASIVFGQPEPIVDGNVARVLQRIHAKQGAADDPEIREWCWQLATDLALAAHDGNGGPPRSAASFNEGLMELGAIVCTPKAPACNACPAASICAARRDGLVDQIPTPKRKPTKRALWCATALVEDDQGRRLVEQRPTTTGMWAGLWQAPTLESTDAPPTRAALAAKLGLPARTLRKLEAFAHQTTHRDVEFVVYAATTQAAPVGMSLRSRAEIAALGLSNPQSRILLQLGAPRPTAKNSSTVSP